MTCPDCGSSACVDVARERVGDALRTSVYRCGDCFCIFDRRRRVIGRADGRLHEYAPAPTAAEDRDVGVYIADTEREGR